MKIINIVIEDSTSKLEIEKLKLNTYCQTIVDQVLSTTNNTANNFDPGNGDE